MCEKYMFLMDPFATRWWEEIWSQYFSDISLWTEICLWKYCQVKMIDFATLLKAWIWGLIMNTFMIIGYLHLRSANLSLIILNMGCVLVDFIFLLLMYNITSSINWWQIMFTIFVHQTTIIQISYNTRIRSDF